MLQVRPRSPLMEVPPELSIDNPISADLLSTFLTSLKRVERNSTVPVKLFIFWHFWSTQINVPGKTKGETARAYVWVKEGVCLFEETSVCSSNAASGGSRPRQERRDRRSGNKKGAGTCECRGTTEVMMGRPSPQQEPVSGVTPPTSTVSVLEPRPGGTIWPCALPGRRL